MEQPLCQQSNENNNEDNRQQSLEYKFLYAVGLHNGRLPKSCILVMVINSIAGDAVFAGKKRGEIPRPATAGRLRQPTPSRERRRKKKRRLAALGMTVMRALA